MYQHLLTKAPRYDISSEGEGRSDEIPAEVAPRLRKSVLSRPAADVSMGQHSSSYPGSPEGTRCSQEWHRGERSTNSACYSVELASARRGYGTEDSGGLPETPASGNRGHAQKISDEEWWPDEVDLNTVTIGNMYIDNQPVETDGKRGRYREITVDSGAGESVVNPDEGPTVDLKPSNGAVKGQRYVVPGG